MCGIAGKLVFEQRQVSESDIRKMTDAIVHRGPDDAGVYISKDRRLGLGHRRLAIIDRSPLGHQPMAYRDRYQIVFNGEIYNFSEKRELLQREGYTFKSGTDTEVILALYDKYREKCVDHLRGMFAFAIYDEKERVLFCARDRIGKKPFKYYYNGRVFLFASELKAILTQPEYTREPDYEAIHHFLTLQYCPAPYTGFKDIHKLEPAHYLLVNLKTGELKKRRYWQLDYSKKLSLSESEWSERILDKLEESVKLRLVADVPLGAFLSGGIDSSAVVGLMARHSTQPVKTFSIGFEEQQFNELPYAKQIAERFGAHHTEFIVKQDALKLLPMLVKQYEEPYADSSALPSYYVSKLTREHVTVALNGDGGDENFAGYDRYSIFKMSLAAQSLGWLQYGFSPPAALLHRLHPTVATERLVRFIQTLSLPYQQRLTAYTSFFTAQQRVSLYSQSMFEHVERVSLDTYELIAKKFNEAKVADPLDQMLYADIATYLPEDLLVKVDISTMAVSLEGRSPFLDHEFMELAAQIPADLKLCGINNKKHILKKALGSLLPHEVMNRQKRGFSIPIAEWFRGPIGDYAEGVLLDSRAHTRELFKSQEIGRLFKLHRKTHLNYGHHLWALMTLELWFREYFDDNAQT